MAESIIPNTLNEQIATVDNNLKNCVYYSSIQADWGGGGTAHSVQIPAIPGKTIKAIIPVGFAPSNTYNTIIWFQYVDLTNRMIYARDSGGGNDQKYTIYYFVIAV